MINTRLGRYAKQGVEIGSASAGLILGSEAALYSMNAYGYADMPWVHHIPGAEHSSSMVFSCVLGTIAVGATERIAHRLEVWGRDGAAGAVRRAGNAITLVGSFACQLGIEMGTRNTFDTWDVVAGTLATIPGMIAGGIMGRENESSCSQNIAKSPAS